VTHSGGKVRMVTHLDIDDAGIAIALDAWRGLAAETTAAETKAKTKEGQGT
jgi:hypothetical protein